MATNKTTAGSSKTANNNHDFFRKENYILMAIGLVVIGLGFFLMAGGKSTDPKQFNSNEVYSTTRITVAPILIILGFVIEIFAIMKKPKTENN